MAVVKTQTSKYSYLFFGYHEVWMHFEILNYEEILWY